MKSMRKPICYSILFAGLTGIFFFGGGLVVTLLEHHAPERIVSHGIITAISVFLVILSVQRMMRGGRSFTSGSEDVGGAAGPIPARHLVFSAVFFLLLATVSLLLLNFTASYFSVPWPLNGLHGVEARQGKYAWAHFEQAPGFIPVNTWGQRDDENKLKPEPGTNRIVFVGDSFLEEGAAVPLPVRTERMLHIKGKPKYEIINLGVSATAPDEYYYRIKNIGLHMEPRHCLMFLYSGNDFTQEASLWSFWGITATYPRDSLLSLLGLNALNHVLSNHRRPVLQAWFKGGELLKNEMEMAEKFRNNGSDEETESTLLSFFPYDEQVRLKSVLHQASPTALHRFYGILRQPDENRFRSYYLETAARYALGDPAPQFIGSEYSFRWVKGAYELCRKRGIGFTLVMIPDAFMVDPRMAGQWLPLANMKMYMQHKAEAIDRIINHARLEGMDVVDLRDILKGVPGTYLNLDGHWSQYGVDLIAAFLAERIEKGAVFQDAVLEGRR